VIEFERIDGCPKEVDAEIFYELGQLLRWSVEDRDRTKFSQIVEFVEKLESVYRAQPGKTHLGSSVRRSLVDLMNYKLNKFLAPYDFTSIPVDANETEFDEQYALCIRTLKNIAGRLEEQPQTDPLAEVERLAGELSGLDTRITKAEGVIDSKLDAAVLEVKRRLDESGLEIIDGRARTLVYLMALLFLAAAGFAGLVYLGKVEIGKSPQSESRDNEVIEGQNRVRDIGVRLARLQKNLQELQNDLQERDRKIAGSFHDLNRRHEEKLQQLRLYAKSIESRLKNSLSGDATSARGPGNSSQLVRLQKQVEDLWGKMEQLRKGMRSPATGSDLNPPEIYLDEERLSKALLPIELDVLRQNWERNFASSDEIGRLFRDVIENGSWAAQRDFLLIDLPRCVSKYEQVKASCETALAPVRQFDNLASRISPIRRLVKGDLPPLDSSTKELVRVRDYSNFLSALQNSDRSTGRLNFNLRAWIADRFREFADHFLRFYQEARMQGRLGEDLKIAYRIICDVLEWADLKPIDIELGNTVFNSRVHVGRGTQNVPQYGEGVIVGVVRSGFRNSKTDEIIKQPEVVVNRI
jgi:molecular chaperone GrpE (heat shock protein)